MYKQGMLWLDKEKVPMAERVAGAVAHFSQKYRKRPAYVLANEKELAEEVTVGGVTVKPCRAVVRCHLVVVES